MSVVAIDGPAGAGKSTVARGVAQRLGWQYVDTGAMYRAVALAALDAGLELSDGAALGSLAGDIEITLAGDSVSLDGNDVSETIRRADVTEAVSKVSAHPEVRDALLEKQRRWAALSDVVMEGRDIGTAVVPGAEVKIYLTASLEERARRRWSELDESERPPLLEVQGAIGARDERDSTRATAPLTRADDAVELDTTGMSTEEVIAEIIRITQERLQRD